MKRRILTIIVMITLVGVGLMRFYNDGFYFYKFANASPGMLEVEYLGDPISGPIFSVQNMLPGDCEEREVIVRNASSNNFDVFVKSENEQDPDNLSSQIDWEIKKESTVLLSDILKNYYSDNDGISLGNFAGGTEAHIFFKGCFKPEAGNEYQNTMTQFDLVFVTEFGHTPPHQDIPAECAHLNIKKFIIGNNGNNHLFGSSKSDFIDGRGGNDHIWGLSSDDCLVGGEGNDSIWAGSGNDMVLGNNGNDTLRGESGEDKIWGHAGNDSIFGGSGDDELFGNEGNDNIHADAGSDKLDGGANTDTLHGGTGVDTCVAGESNSSCEL